eukprot:6818400-Alexandrium_andersonii.AAC.1
MSFCAWFHRARTRDLASPTETAPFSSTSTDRHRLITCTLAARPAASAFAGVVLAPFVIVFNAVAHGCMGD